MPLLIIFTAYVAATLILISEYDNGKTLLVQSWLAVLGVLEWTLIWIEIGVFYYFGWIENVIITLICGFVATIAVNIILMIFYLKKMRHNLYIKQHIDLFRKTHLSFLLLSVFLNSKIFKALYCSLGGSKYLSMSKDFMKDYIIGKYYKIIHYCSLIPTCLMALNAVFNLALSVPPNVTTTILIDIERLILSAFIIALTLIEFNEKAQQRP